jgi:hypothetical protein
MSKYPYQSIAISYGYESRSDDDKFIRAANTLMVVWRMTAKVGK